ncbi:glycosyltransferase family 2 protein [Psychroserpens sp.]|uniref:glycosyltransferase family 2 protein n=1 Tax=Psychroserpens sp. TaxID=2020870 RepID=UPI001B22CB05|nr:glycosyltransferase [Psychroserpens sp.]MBO6606148.1 glycosyltransferase [Psychroserpens sp.]MBO6632660.1 glycosyltransferase [Psychroserpens sp.]MBO6652480.1 glycosyltransferase [Psychroserpens sp.]MBO6681748.1 glycosyltransferase [Psychroserpens sp.]MBO6749523.1 glycosyltransferase [Psychroserpens sp.]
MLSILLPVYNFDVRPLVNKLHEQLSTTGVTYEIICLDDASDSSFTSMNKAIEDVEGITYSISEINHGRVATRQFLAEKAKYNWLLFLDADVMPKSEHFIRTYLEILNQDFQAVYGGFAYYEDVPVEDQRLRWNYGRSKEQVSAKHRNQKPYKITISANLLIQKDIFKQLNTQIDQKGYGYDNYFASLLKQHQVKVMHIDNEVYHLGLESNATYLNKVEEAIQNLLNLDKSGAIAQNENSLLNAYHKIRSMKLNGLCAFLFDRFNTKIKRNLLSAKPSIRLLQFYKLGYICYLDLNS